MMTRGKGVAQVSEHDYPKKKHKSRQEDMQRKMSSSQETTLYEIFDFSGLHRDAGGSGGSASSEGIQGSSGAKDKSVLEVVDEGDKGDDDNDDEADNDQVMFYLKFDARHNVCAYIDVTYASTVGFRDALSWLSRSKDSHAISYTIREVLNNGDERRHKIKANMDYNIACFNRMGYVGNFKKDLVIKTMLSREWKCITHIIIGDTFLMYPCFIQMILNAKLKNLPTTGCQLKLTHMGKTIVVDMRESGDVEVENVQEENIEGDVPQQHEQQGEGLQGGNAGGVEERIELSEITKAERKVLNERRVNRKHERQAPSGI
ncbi:hypothetical protein L1987_24000 [Smallanthus sonchifolius]|uniref:Uncharacterized protein n=1 Tax=Smallanthus sonchifolius TaxID=185202 RepID=A0ACB9III0_9ASTR|nr:hypothetical protein L1987_24000 [Smallanthus sonchifolius]